MMSRAKPAPKIKGDVAEHETVEHLVVDFETPEHVQRTESDEFVQNKNQLVHQHQFPCWSCGSTEHLEVHHNVEWSQFNDVDGKQFLRAVKAIDWYGLGGQGGDRPVTSPDDIRNLVVLCVKCHRGAGTGIHNTPFPLWMAQACAKSGEVVLKPKSSKTEE